MATPAYADIFNFFSGVPSVYGGSGGNDLGYWTGGKRIEQQGGGEGGTVDREVFDPYQFHYGATTPAAQSLLDKYGQMVTGAGEYGGAPTYDFSKLPGGGIVAGGYSIDQFMPVNATTRSKLANPNAVINDPNYGPITLLSNVKQTRTDKFASMLPMLAAGALTGGVLGAIGAPAGLAQLLSMGRGMAMGGGNPLTSLLSMFGGNKAQTSRPQQQGSGLILLLRLLAARKGGGG